MTTTAGFLQMGLQAFEQGRFVDAIRLFEQACQQGTPGSVEYVRSQINLVRSYERTQEFDKALALCQQLVSHSDSRVNGWAKQALQSLSTMLGTPAYTDPEATTLQSLPPSSTPPVSPISSSPTPSSTASPSTPPRLTPSEAAALLQSSKIALKEKRYTDAIAALEAYTQGVDRSDKDYAQAQVWLAKAYKGNRQVEEAIAITRQLVDSQDPMIQSWAQQFMASLAVGAVLNAVAPEAVPHLNGLNESGMLNGSANGDANGQTNGSNGHSTASEAPNAKPAHPPLQSLEQLKAFYQQHLLKDLKLVERDRKALLQQISFASLLFLVIPGMIAIAVITQGINFFWVLAGYTLILTLWVGTYSLVTGKYYRNFKNLKIVEKIIHGINPELTYSPYGAPSNYNLRTAYHESELFSHLALPNRFFEDDGVAGWIGDTYITFGEVMAEGEQQRGGRNGELRLDAIAGISYVLNRVARGQRVVFEDFLNEAYGSSTRYPIFKGILFAANFNKQFKHKTMVVPDVAERFLGGIGKMFQSMNKRHGDLVKLEDIEFEKYFAVYSGDQIEARYILSTSLMERLIRFRKRSGRDISVSFVNNTIFVTIAYEEDLFEPKLFKSMLNFQLIQEYFENLQLVIGIVEELKLNRRIWGKLT